MTPRARAAGRATVALMVALAIALAITLAEVYAIRKLGRSPVALAPRATAPAAVVPPSAQAAPKEPLRGSIDEPAAEATVGSRVAISGWAHAPDGVRAVEARVAGQVFRAQLRAATAGVPASAGQAATGFAIDVDAGAAAFGVDRRRVDVYAIGSDGRESLLGTRSLISPEALRRWSAHAGTAGEPFHLLPALSGVALGAAAGLDTAYAAYVSPTMRVGTRVPVLYMRTTRGAAHDFVFDPDWDIGRRCAPGSERRLSDDSLNGVIAHAKKHSLPVLFTLNGGVWADAACDVSEWDATDMLERDPANSQWSEKDEVPRDNALSDLPGAFASPELGRMLTLNVHARDVRRYKKRNLQQAARVLVAFAKERPDLFVGVNLDPDLTLNPFFSHQKWFDFNPGTLRQFREWLAGSGPYAGRAAGGAPDLSAYRRAKPLTLREASRLAGREFARWEDVQPPRDSLLAVQPAWWNGAWLREWETFRRHLVDLHYDELSRWLVEAGVPAARIWSSQGFMAPLPNGTPFALRVASPVKNFDSGGVSVEGAKPASGHLGAVLYGNAALNDIPMEGPRTLFGAFASFDPRWAVVEYNSADLRRPKELPTYADAYRGLREMWNHGARYVSPMAWPGPSGRNAGQQGYDPYMAWRDTPLEEAARDFMAARADLTLGSRLWTFGSAQHADDDGWRAERGKLAARPGHLLLEPDGERRVAIVSPRELALDGRRAWRVVLVAQSGAVEALRVEGRSAADAPWLALADAAGPVVDLPRRAGAPLEQLRLTLVTRGAEAAALARVALIPR